MNSFIWYVMRLWHGESRLYTMYFGRYGPASWRNVLPPFWG